MRARLLLAAVSLLACATALELVVRLVFPREVDTALLHQLQDDSSLRSIVEPSADSALLFELRPNLRLLFVGAWVITSADRRRISGAPVKTDADPADAVRVAVLGDSTPFGWGVGYEASYPERFRQRMEELSGRPVVLRNYSVPGYNAVQELRLFETQVAGWKPHLVIVHHDHNDAVPTAKMMGVDYMPPEYGDNALHSALLKWTARRLRRMRNESARAAATEQRMVAGYIASGPLYEAQLAARRGLVEEAHTMGASVVIVIFNAVVKRDPHWQQSEVYTVLHRDLGARLAPMGYRVLDLFPLDQAALEQHGWEDMHPWWRSAHPIDAHPNLDEHRFIADRLVDFVQGDPALVAVFARRPTH